MITKENAVVRSQQGILASNSVLKNTYFLLSLTLLFSAATAAYAMSTQAKGPGLILSLVGIFGLSFLVSALRNSVWGIVATFIFTGFLGYMLGPMLNLVIHQYANGGQIVMTALGATGFIFLTLSGYVLTTKKNFSYLGGFLFAGILVAFIAGIAGVLFQMPMLNLVVSGAFALLCSGLILFHTSQIVNGGEQNYIMATIGIYMALFNLFTSLLNILLSFSGNRD